MEISSLLLRTLIQYLDLILACMYIRMNFTTSPSSLAYSPIQVLGACWYLLSIERQEACWRSFCDIEGSSCKHEYFDCRKVTDPVRSNWFKSSNITTKCNSNADSYPFGIYGDALTSDVTSSPFFNKYFYCLWWGLKNLR